MSEQSGPSRGAPRPLAPVLDEAGSDGVREHVLERALVVLLVADHPRREAGAEDVAVATMPAIEALRVFTVQVLHPCGQPLDRRLDDQVVVRAHQAEGVAIPEVAPDDER